MGKTAWWFRGRLGEKKATERYSPPPESACTVERTKYKRWWSLLRYCRDDDRNALLSIGKDERRGSSKEGSSCSCVDGADPNKHAIAVAAATAAVAEAAVAAAQAAQAIVRLTGSRTDERRREMAALRIQAAFRGYLARKALRALKGLVKVQAFVRGNIVRKRNRDRLRSMQTLLRVQEEARSCRSRISETLHFRSKSSISDHLRCGSKSNSKDIFYLAGMHLGSKRLDHWTDENLWACHREASMQYSSYADDVRDDRILVVDTGKDQDQHNYKRTIRQLSRQLLASDQNSYGSPTMGSPISKDSTTAPKSMPSLSSDYSVDDSSQFSASSIAGSERGGGSFMPTKSHCSVSSVSDCSYHPNYMANTESSRAKVRSLSAPKQRPEIEKYSSSMKRYSNSSVHGLDETASSGHRTSALHVSFRNKA